MVTLFSGRTDVAIKHRYRKLMRKSNHLEKIPQKEESARLRIILYLTLSL
jgi:hypothetical protein